MAFTNRNFTPRLGQGELPDLSEYTVLTQPDFERGADTWNDRMPSEYQDLLYARIVGEVSPDPTHTVIEKGDWRFLRSVQRYRNKDGMILGDQYWWNLRDKLTDSFHSDVETIGMELVDREITVHEWLRRMARVIRTAHLSHWMFGAGGYNAIDATAVVSLSSVLREQYDYLREFAREIIRKNRPDVTRQDQDALFGISLDTPTLAPRPRPRPPVVSQPDPPGRVTARGLINRAVMYIESATGSAEKGRATTYGFHPDIMPNYPADGSMECLVRCRCHWRFVFPRGQDSFYHAFWTLRGNRPDGRNCATCLRYSVIYNPYTVVRF